MLVEYYFEIEYIKGTDNARVDVFSRKAKLQENKKVKGVILRMDNDSKIKYNYLQLTVTQEELERIYKLLKSFQVERILKAQLKDLDYKEYINKEFIYIPKEIAEVFIKDFYKGIM